MHISKHAHKRLSIILTVVMIASLLLPVMAGAATGVSAVTLSASTTTPSVGGSVTLTANATGASATTKYVFWTDIQGVWSVVANSSSNTYTWANIPAGTYVGVVYAVDGDNAPVQSNRVYIKVGSSSSVTTTVADGKITATATSSNIFNPLYDWWVQDPSGAWTSFYGHFTTNNTMTIANPVAGNYNIVCNVTDPEFFWSLSSGDGQWGSALFAGATAPNVTAGLSVTSVSAINSTSTVPVATKVEAGAKLLVAFSEAIDATTVTDANFKLTSGTVTIATSRTVSTDKKSVTITPVTSLTIGQAYKLTVANVKNAGATTTLAAPSETTFTVADSMAVASLKSGVAGTTILDTFESTGSPLVIEFTKSYDANTVNTSTIKLYNETTKAYAPLTGGILPLTATTVRVTPVAATYLLNNKYTLTVNGVKALDNSEVAAYTKTYGLAASVNVAATVTAIPRSAGTNTAMNGVYPGIGTKVFYAATTPGVGATNAESVTASPFKAQVAFARAMDVTTLNDQNFKIVKVDTTGKEIAGTNVAGTVTFDNDSYIATFTPTAALAESTNYAAIITADVKDAFGVPATVNTTLFTTGDFTAPTVANTSVDNGARVAVDANIVIHFSEPMNVAAGAFGYIAAGAEGLATATTNVDVWDVTGAARVAAPGALNTAFINDQTDPRLIITAPAAGWAMNNIYRVTVNGYNAANPTFLCAADNRNGLLLQATKVITFTTVEASRPTVTSVKTILTADGAAAATANTALSQTTMTYGVQNSGTSGAGANNVFVVTFDQPMLVGAVVANSAQNPASYQLWVDDGIGGGVADDNIFNAAEKYALVATITPVAGTNNKSFSIAPTGASLAKLNGVEHNSRLEVLFNVRAAANTAAVAMGTAATANVTYQFTTGSGPVYANTSVPAKFATNVATNIADLQIDFNEAVDWRTVNSTNIIVKDAAGNAVAGKFYSTNTGAGHAAIAANLASVFFAPDNALKSNTTYTIQVTNGVKDAVGNASAGYSYTFTTADTTVPVATITMPSATSGTDPIIVQYNTPMGAAASAAGSYTLTVAGAPAVFRAVASADTKTASIYPDIPYTSNQVVSLTVNAGVAATNAQVIAAAVTAEQAKGTIAPAAAYNVKTATYNPSSKALVLTLTRPCDNAAPAAFADFTFGSATVVAANFIGCAVSADGLTVTIALQDTAAAPLAVVPGVSTIALSGATARYNNSLSVATPFSGTARTITLAN